MSDVAIIAVLVALACLLGLAYVGVEFRRAVRGCSTCQGVADCPTCGPAIGRTR